MANKADNQIKWVLNKMPKSDDKQVANMSLEEMSKANNFHKSFPQYSVTPLTGLPHLAEYLGLKKLYVKDESYRFGLNAFKVLGGSYAIARYMAQQLGKDAVLYDEPGGREGEGVAVKVGVAALHAVLHESSLCGGKLPAIAFFVFVEVQALAETEL